MTAIARGGSETRRRAAPHDVVRWIGAAVALIAGRLKAQAAEFAAAGQLGPDPETEMGRWTGARM